jgi:pSer/pThr/pTyr-binding forkhead associated (FHA) protein
VFRRYLIGRGGDCDIVIGEQTVSRHHAALVRFGDRWLLEDLGSKNGTAVNGEAIAAPAPLREGDFVSFGAFGLVFSPAELSERRW